MTRRRPVQPGETARDRRAHRPRPVSSGSESNGQHPAGASGEHHIPRNLPHRVRPSNGPRPSPVRGCLGQTGGMVPPARAAALSREETTMPRKVPHPEDPAGTARERRDRQDPRSGLRLHPGTSIPSAARGSDPPGRPFVTPADGARFLPEPPLRIERRGARAGRAVGPSATPAPDSWSRRAPGRPGPVARGPIQGVDLDHAPS